MHGLGEQEEGATHTVPQMPNVQPTTTVAKLKKEVEDLKKEKTKREGSKGVVVATSTIEILGPNPNHNPNPNPNPKVTNPRFKKRVGLSLGVASRMRTAWYGMGQEIRGWGAESLGISGSMAPTRGRSRG